MDDVTACGAETGDDHDGRSAGTEGAHGVLALTLGALRVDGRAGMPWLNR